MNNRKTKWLPWLVIAIVLSLGVNAYLFIQHRDNHGGAASGAGAEIYVCPMHPQVVSDHPADCPICGMKLVKRQSVAGGDVELDSLAASVHLSPTQEILANVRTELPVTETFMAMRKFPGRIAVKEDAQWKVNARVMGRVERLYVATPGQPIRKGQPLYDLYSPDLSTAQREYALAREISDPRTRELLVSAARNKLLSLGMQEGQVATLETTGGVREVLTFRAPNSGVLMEKMISEGEWTMPGMEMFDFVDLAEVWVEGTVYEQDITGVRMGDPVSVSPAGDPTRRVTARVSFISPMVDMMTRTLIFRAALPNPDLSWRPEQFVEVSWMAQRSQEALSVPEDAVLATGQATRVWVKVADGRFQPREVMVGARQNGRVAILAGLGPMEEVVVSGGYLVDSDAQMKSIGAGHVHGGEPAPTASPEDHSRHGAVAAPATSTTVARAEGKYYCTMCPEITSDEPGRCSKCGMKLVERVHESHAEEALDLYICTMCPEVKAHEPGRCPKCGMYLVKKEG